MYRWIILNLKPLCRGPTTILRNHLHWPTPSAGHCGFERMGLKPPWWKSSRLRMAEQLWNSTSTINWALHMCWLPTTARKLNVQIPVACIKRMDRCIRMVISCYISYILHTWIHVVQFSVICYVSKSVTPYSSKNKSFPCFYSQEPGK